MKRLTGLPSTKRIDAPATGDARSGSPPRLPGRANIFRDAERWLRFARRPDLMPEVPMPPRPPVLILTTVLLVGLGALLAIWGRPPTSGHWILHPDHSSRNLNNTSATEPTEPIAPALHGEDSTKPRDTLEAGFAGLELPPVQPAPLVPPSALPMPKWESAEKGRVAKFAAEEPILPVKASETARPTPPSVRRPPPGDSTMLSTWKKLGLHTLLAAALTTAHGRAQVDGNKSDANKDANKAEMQKLEDIQKQLDRLNKSMTEVQSSLSALDSFKDSMRESRTRSDLALQNALSDLRSEIEKLKTDVAALRSREPASQSRTSGFLSTDPGAAAKGGHVVMFNTYPSEVAVVVNRKTYYLAPGETRISDEIPPGAFTYEVLGVTPQRARSMSPSESFMVHVHP